MNALGKTDMSLDRPTFWKSPTDHHHHVQHLWLDFLHGSKSRCRGFQPWTPSGDPSDGRFLAYRSCLFSRVSGGQYDHWLFFSTCEYSRTRRSTLPSAESHLDAKAMLVQSFISQHHGRPDEFGEVYSFTSAMMVFYRQKNSFP